MNTFATLLVFFSLSSLSNGEVLDLCTSDIYCRGPLLDTVQMAQIFNDSKTFVDMKMKKDESEILDDFRQLIESTNSQPSQEQVRGFVERNFEEGNELLQWQPPDFKPAPKFLNQIHDLSVKRFAKDIVAIWPTLGRKIKPSVVADIKSYSFIPVPNGFIVAGGRFSEYYYWDTYWIVKGLLLSGMKETVRGILDNFVILVDQFGFIPNGGRVYYLNRSQPPLFTAMVELYIKETNDLYWLKKNIDTLEKELQFWINTQVVTFKKNGKMHSLAHYSVESSTPRPESYVEDVETASYFQSSAGREKTYRELKSGAESGWDFSSRWIFDRQANLSHIETSRVIPVDLNSFLCKSFYTMSSFHLLLNNPCKSIFWKQIGQLWRRNIEEVLWNSKDGIWYDYDIKTQKQRPYFYASNFAPLWSECYDASEGQVLGKRALAYLRANYIFIFQGGIPTSLLASGQQWDFSNAWAPLQAIVVQGLDFTGNKEAKNAAKELAKKWVKANMIGYSRTQEMFEKYDAVNPGSSGEGGEYTVQTGFGWSNGVVLEFINTYYTSKHIIQLVNILNYTNI